MKQLTGPISGIVSEPMLNLVKTCIYLRVRLLFDPPVSSWVLAASERQLAEHEWRLSEMREATAWVDPDPPVNPPMIWEGWANGLDV